jgi:hypothetical protein
MTPEEAYEEALRRIRAAEETGAVELDLRGWKKTPRGYTGLETLNRLPSELERLISLQSLNLSVCQLSGDLSPLASLTSLQSLDLSECMELSGDLSPLAGLTSPMAHPLRVRADQRPDPFGRTHFPPNASAIASGLNLVVQRSRFGKHPLYLELLNVTSDQSIAGLQGTQLCF